MTLRHVVIRILFPILICILGMIVALSLCNLGLYTSWFYDDSNARPSVHFFGALSNGIANILWYFLGSGAWGVPLLCFLCARLLSGFMPARSFDRFCGSVVLICVWVFYCAAMQWDVLSIGMPGGVLGNALHNGIMSSSLAPYAYQIFMVVAVAALFLVFGYQWAASLVGMAKQISTLGWWGVAERLVKGVWSTIRTVNARIIDAVQSWMANDTPRDTFEDIAREVLMDPVWSNLEEAGEPDGSAQGEPVRQKVIVEPATVKKYEVPTSALLVTGKNKQKKEFTEDTSNRSTKLEEKLGHFGIHGKVVSTTVGPTVTLYEYQPRADMKISSILAREDDLALALEAHSLRIIAPIPGTSVIGFEVANQHREPVLFSDILATKEWKQAGAKLGAKIPLVLGVDTVGKPCIVDLTTLPHALIAGSTGSGKSVAMHALLTSMLMSRSPADLKLILIDPKRIEFANYEDVPHLLFEVVTQPHMAVKVLAWAVRTMEQRYDLMAQAGVRSVHEYHEKFGSSEMPFMVIMIDELADLMMVAQKDCEGSIARLAQMARACGIHLIVATQRPSVDVITGVVKVNFPTRLAFRLASKIDSRTILDASGAEKLLGKGDMLFLDNHGLMRRVHGAFLNQSEIQAVVDYVKSQAEPEYIELGSIAESNASGDAGDGDSKLMQDIRVFLGTTDEISISLLQRRFRIGYNRSARIIDQLEAEGLISAASGSKMRKVVHENR